MDVPTTRESCIACGFVFWVPTSFYYRRQEDHKSFYCPACRGDMHYPSKTDAEKCEEKVASLKRQRRIDLVYQQRLRDDIDRTERRRISQKGATTKLRNQLDELKE